MLLCLLSCCRLTWLHAGVMMSSSVFLFNVMAGSRQCWLGWAPCGQEVWLLVKLLFIGCFVAFVAQDDGEYVTSVFADNVIRHKLLMFFDNVV